MDPHGFLTTVVNHAYSPNIEPAFLEQMYQRALERQTSLLSEARRIDVSLEEVDRDDVADLLIVPGLERCQEDALRCQADHTRLDEIRIALHDA